jgi:hypothetical protein
MDSMAMADDALTKAGEAALDYMNSRQARSFESKTKQVSDMADVIDINGVLADGGQAIIAATEQFMENITSSETKREI